MSSSQELTDSRLNQLPDGLRVVGKVELTRRRFGARVAKLGVLAATIAGGIVGFAPSAQAIVCIPGTKGPLAGPGSCSQSCIGLCEYYQTCCAYHTSPDVDQWCCFCLDCMYRSKPFVKCLHSGSYGCCIAC